VVRVEELAGGGKPQLDQVEQQPARQPQALVDGERIVQARVVDQSLPPDRGARLLEVDAHHDAQVRIQPGGLGAKAAGVVERRDRVVHRAGADDHHQAIVLRGEDADDLVPRTCHVL